MEPVIVELDPEVWGCGSEGGYLLNHGKMCCLGIYLSQRGVEEGRLMLHAQPSEIYSRLLGVDEFNWLLDGWSGGDSVLSRDLMGVNDSMGYDDDMNARVEALNRELEELDGPIRFKLKETQDA